MNALAEKVAVVTGGAGGIGEAIVRRFIAEGARVVFGDIREQKGERIAQELGDNCLFVRADVLRETDVEALMDAAIDRFHHLDCVVNNAGTSGVHGSIADVPTDGFDATIQLLLRSVFLGMKHGARRIRNAGTIINIASIAALQAGYGGHAYSAAKAGIVQLTRTTAMELGERHIRVNCICPGGVATGIFGTVIGLTADVAEQTVEAIKPWIATGSPLHRPCLPEDIANAVLWLATPEAAFVNGHALIIDGGTTGGRLWSQSQSEGAQLVQTLIAAASHRPQL